jgi:hypothetical protein
VTSREDIQKLVDAAVKTFDRIDVLVNNAGVMPLSLIERLKVDEWEQMRSAFPQLPRRSNAKFSAAVEARRHDRKSSIAQAISRVAKPRFPPSPSEAVGHH